MLTVEGLDGPTATSRCCGKPTSARRAQPRARPQRAETLAQVEALFPVVRARRAQLAHTLSGGLARFAAAHCPTPRALRQTYQIALRLQRGEELFQTYE